MRTAFDNSQSQNITVTIRQLRTLTTYFCAVFCLIALTGKMVAAADDAVDYAADIRPIFENHCYKCHGPARHESDFRLDIKSRALKGGESGEPAILPGNCEKSQLLERISSDDPDVRMPPKDQGDPLTEKEINTLRFWIEKGAAWPDNLANEESLTKKHWAFVAPVRPSVPQLNSNWPANPIDNFVLTRLQSEKLQPSAEADKTTLIRRLSLDLIGLPPTQEEVDAFLRDTSANAYERLVERLLASPHYGERWGRMWLDAARYADSNGFEKDFFREVWFYRDWVINALNQDLPYDQFIIQQIAGDELPNATQQQKVATGFLRNSMLNEEGGVDAEEVRMAAMFDRMDTIGKSILGITIQCAQCHNHKYDPLSQEEYYRMFAFLNNTNEGSISVYTPDEEKQSSNIRNQISQIENGLKRDEPDWQKQMAAWEETAQEHQPDWKVVELKLDDILSAKGQRFVPMDDGSLLSQGTPPIQAYPTFTIHADPGRITGFRLELLCDPSLPRTGPGRSPKGIAALSEFEVEVANTSARDKKSKVKIGSATADFSEKLTGPSSSFIDPEGNKRSFGPIEFAIDDDIKTAWTTDAGPGLRNQPRKAVFIPENPIEVKDDTVVFIRLSQRHGNGMDGDLQQHNLGRFRLSVTSEEKPLADPLPPVVREILRVPVDQRTPEQMDVIFSFWRTTVPGWKDANAKIAELWKTFPEGYSQLVLSQCNKPRETSLLKRGDFLQPDHKVTCGVPSFLNPLPEGAPPTRLSFARWLVDRDSPTTARSIVNRVWQAYFGVGLVASSENLGKQCEPPSHPELLDWLAVELIDHGWSLKQLHRLIVSSATYRQASTICPENYARDPYNRLLARGPRFRADAEVIRDIQLSVSGLLNPKMGGPSAHPEMPNFLLKKPYVFTDKIWPEATNEDQYRRAVYTCWYRSSPYPMLQTFDAPSSEASCVRRPRSNTPLQALVTLNETISTQCAQALARKTLEQPELKDNRSRLVYAFRRCVSREPTQKECDRLLAFYEQEKKRIAEGWLDPWQLAGAETKAPDTPKGSTPTELAAWACVTRVLLNLDETITKD